MSISKANIILTSVFIFMLLLDFLLISNLKKDLKLLNEEIFNLEFEPKICEINCLINEAKLKKCIPQSIERNQSNLNPLKNQNIEKETKIIVQNDTLIDIYFSAKKKLDTSTIFERLNEPNIIQSKPESTESFIAYSEKYENTKSYSSSLGNPNPKKIVLLEEFVGVRCALCPSGSSMAEYLEEKYRKQIVVVSIHSYHFSKPYQNGENFEIEEGKQIANFLWKGKSKVYPSGSINRNLFGGESQLVLVNSKWEKFIVSELSKPTIVSIQLNIVQSEPNHLQFTTSLRFLEKIQTAINLSVMLIEDNIINPQNVNDNTIDNYEHNNVLRAMLTPPNGVSIALSVEKGAIFNNQFFFKDFADYWNINNMSIVAFIHGKDKRLSVLQAIQVKINK